MAIPEAELGPPIAASDAAAVASPLEDVEQDREGHAAISATQEEEVRRRLGQTESTAAIAAAADGEIAESVKASLEDLMQRVAAALTPRPPLRYTGSMAAHILQQMYWRKVEKEELQLQELEQSQSKAAIKIQSIVRLFITCTRLRQQWTDEALSIMKEEERRHKAKLKATQDKHINKLIGYEQSKRQKWERKAAEKVEEEAREIASIITMRHKGKDEVDRAHQQGVISKLTSHTPSQKKAEKMRRHEVEFAKKHGRLFARAVSVSAPSASLLKPTISLEWTGSSGVAFEDEEEEEGSTAGSRYMFINYRSSAAPKDVEGDGGSAGKGHSPTGSIRSFQTSPGAPSNMFMTSTVSNLFREAENFERNASKFMAPKQSARQLRFAEFHTERARKEYSCLHVRTKKRELMERRQCVLQTVATARGASVTEGAGNSPLQSVDDASRRAASSSPPRPQAPTSSLLSTDSLTGKSVLSMKARGLGGYNFVADPASLLDTPLISRSFNSSYSKPTESQKAMAISPEALLTGKRRSIDAQPKTQSPPHPLPRMETKVDDKELQEMYRVRALLQQQHHLNSGKDVRGDGQWLQREEEAKAARDAEIQRRLREQARLHRTTRLGAHGTGGGAPTSPQVPFMARSAGLLSPRKVVAVIETKCT